MSRSVNIKEKMKFPSHAPHANKSQKKFQSKNFTDVSKTKNYLLQKNPDFSPKKLNLQ